MGPALVVAVGGTTVDLHPPAPAPARRAFAALAAAAVLAVAGLQAWPRVDTRTGGDPAPTPADVPAVDAAGVAEAVSHAVVPAAGGDGALEAHDAGYLARFGPAGFSVDAPAGGAGLGLSLTRLGGTAVVAQPWQGRANVATRRVAPGATERVTARQGELEWDVVLDDAPPGAGDLVVDATLDGLAGPAVRGAAAWDLPVAGGRVGVDELVVVDATGKELHRELPSIDGGRLRLEVPAEVLASARYPVVLDPTVSPAFPVTGPPQPGAQSDAAAAFDGTNYLVVWTDCRGCGQFEPPQVAGARISPSGAVLDPGGFPIALRPAFQGEPAVAFDGTNFLVAWSEGGDVRGAQVRPNGTVAPGAGFPISAAAGVQGDPAIVDGPDGIGDLLVAWEDRRGTTSDIYAAHVSSAGVVRGTGGVPVSAAAGDQTDPTLARLGGNSLVAWEDTRAGGSDVYAARVAPNGAVLDPAGIALSTAAGAQADPAVAVSGGVALAVWSDARSGPSDILGARVDEGGQVLEPDGVTVGSAAGAQTRPTVSRFGASFQVLWEDARSGGADVYGTPVSASGGGGAFPSGLRFAAGPATQADPALAAGGTGALALWDDGTGTAADVFGARVASGGGPVEPVGLLVSRAQGGIGVQDLAFDGTNFLVVSSGYAIRVAPSGANLDPRPLELGVAGAVAFGGGTYLVVGASEYGSAGPGIYGLRLGPDGSVLGPPFPISTGQGQREQPDLAFDGTNFLVAWRDTRSGGLDPYGGPNGDIYGARVRPSGEVLDPAGRVLTASVESSGFPAVASAGGQSLVVWQEFGATGRIDVRATRVSAAGATLDGPSIRVDDGGNAASVASDGTGYLVAWTDDRSDNADVYARRIDASGAVLDGTGIPVATGGGSQEQPALAFNGDYLVAWRNRPVFGASELRGGRVRRDGTRADGGGFLLTGIDPAGSYVLSVGPTDRWGLASTRPSPGVNPSTDTLLRTVSPK